MLEILPLFLSWLVFWITLGMTEGYKWTTTPKIVTASNYHVFRSITTTAVLGIAILSGKVYSGLATITVLGVTIALNLGTWPFYEMALNWVNWGVFFKKKGDFVLGPITLKHLPPQLILALASVGGIALCLLLQYA